MRDSRQLEDPSLAQLEDAGSEETRNLIGRLHGTMHGPSDLRVHCIETPGTPVSGVFIFGRLTSGCSFGLVLSGFVIGWRV